ncbi:Esterase/lipase [Serratia grimesii]|jgi:alpha-beta hydrolase superfamily lysophospholipase|uniref:alpha/beta hydrolase n=1 Tax=Serratia grimesii TaxID=82995 RepID=UPI000A4D3057|nr:alpha/beta fold hydrolase [Serratia grimesii]CAI2786151.1 Esterase/lipase [Serratia grimesii]
MNGEYREAFTLIDFKDYIEKAKCYHDTLTTTATISAGNVEGLSYRLYQHMPDTRDVMIVYHGGGVNSDAGYDILARQLTTDRTMAVCLVDIRGHGDSAGERGTVEKPERIWRDVDVVMAEMHRRFPQARRHLFGHSSGAGMLLNYFTCYPFAQRADSLIMLAPELGPFSGTARDVDVTARFADVRQWPFIINALSRGQLFGQYRAVSLNFPSAVLESTLSVVHQYSVNMANALTPRNPAKQLAALSLPTLCLAARQDELLNPTAIQAFVERQGNAHIEFHMIEDSTHLACVFEAHQYVHRHIAVVIQKAANLVSRC